MRVLEALDYVVEELGQSLSYQWFCGVKKCGMCGVMVNGRQTLGCWEPVRPEMVVRPLAGFPVVRDLVIDRSRYFANVQSLEPWIQRRRSYGGFPEAITGPELSAAADTMHCIECMLCVSACPANGERFMVRRRWCSSPDSRWTRATKPIARPRRSPPAGSTIASAAGSAPRSARPASGSSKARSKV